MPVIDREGSPASSEQIIDHGRDLLIPLKRRLKEAPNEGILLALWRLEGRDILPEIVEWAAKEDKSSRYDSKPSPNQTARAFLIDHAKLEAVPATLAAARNVYEKSELISVLARIVDDSTLFKLLHSPTDHELATNIAHSKDMDWSFVAGVLRAFSAPEASVRREAAAAAGTLEPRFAPALAPGLLRLLRDPVANVRETALAALESMEDPALCAKLIDRLGRPDHKLDESRLLEAIAARVNAGVLGECLESESQSRRRGAVTFLARRGISPELLEMVRRLLRDPDPAIRIAAVDCLLNAGDRASLCPLLSMLLDPDAGARQKAEQALQTLCPGLAQTWPSSRDDLVSLVEQIYSSELDRTSGRFVVGSAPIAGLVAAGQEFANSPQGVANLMTALEGAKDVAFSADQAGAVLVATTIAIAGAAHLARKRETADAIILHKQALALSRALNEPRIEWRAWETIGVLCEAIGDDSGAWQAFGRASEVIDRHWFSLVDGEIGRDFFATKAQMYDRAVLCAIRLGHDAAALEYSEKSRTRYLGDLIARRHAARRRELAPQVSEFWAAVERSQSPPASAGDEDIHVSSARSVVAVSWTSEDTEESSWMPKWLSRWQSHESAATRQQGISPYDVWRITAWLAEEPEDRPDVREALEELRAIFVQVLASLRDPSVERRDWETQYSRAALNLTNCKHPKDVKVWVFI